MQCGEFKEKDRRIARIILKRPAVMNAIDDDLPVELAAAVADRCFNGSKAEASAHNQRRLDHRSSVSK